MVQKIEATDVTEEEVLNAAFFERADEFIKQANEFSRVEKALRKTRQKTWSSQRCNAVWYCPL